MIRRGTPAFWACLPHPQSQRPNYPHLSFSSYFSPSLPTKYGHYSFCLLCNELTSIQSLYPYPYTTTMHNIGPSTLRLPTYRSSYLHRFHPYPRVISRRSESYDEVGGSRFHCFNCSRLIMMHGRALRCSSAPKFRPKHLPLLLLLVFSSSHFTDNSSLVSPRPPNL